MPKIIVALISFIFLVSPAAALETSSSNFLLNAIGFKSGGAQISSTNYISILNSSGETTGGISSLQSPSFTSWSDHAHIILLTKAAELRYWISGLKAKTDVLGEDIFESTWQKDTSPYFSWDIDVSPPELITGFSYSLDAQPDTEIDITEPYYQFPDYAIASGKHIFYVMPFSKGVWDTQSTLQFQLWVDSELPVASNLSPPSGEIISNNLIPITCSLYDTDSGVSTDLTTFNLNNTLVPFNYNAETQILEFVPDSPLSEGKNTVLLRVYDMVGNYIVKGWDFIIDASPPAGKIMLNQNQEVTHSAYVFINIDAQDNISGLKNIYLSNDGIFDTEFAVPYSYAPVIPNWLVPDPDIDGVKTVYARFEDAAGNRSEVFQDQITLKLITPDTRIISGPQAITEENKADFQFESSKPSCQFSFKLDSLEWSEWSTSTDAHFLELDQGNHYFYVKSGFDLNGDGEITIDEEDATPAKWNWSVKERVEGESEQKTLFWRR